MSLEELNIYLVFIYYYHVRMSVKELSTYHYHVTDVGEKNKTYTTT